MKILVDANPLYAGQLTGVGYYTESLLHGLRKLNDVDVSGFAFNFMNKQPSFESVLINEQTILPGKLLSYPRYAKVELPLELFFNTKGVDLIMGTNYLLPPSLRHIPSVATIHDLCFIDHPEWVQGRNAHILKQLLPRTIARASGLITISNFSLSRIREIYNYSGPALVVDIPPKTSMAKAKKIVRLDVREHKFFLFVGTIEPRKNLGLALDAYNALPLSLQEEYPFVLAGKPGWDPEVLKRIRNKENKNVHYLDYVTEDERTWLYQNTTATIIPSHYEGFGMMTLESLALGAPTITSDIPPQREILGSYGQYFDTKNRQQLTELLEKFTNAQFRNQVLNDQIKVLPNYSWDKVSRNIIEFVEKIIA